MSLQNFEILNKVGEGAYSEVHKVRRKSDNKIYALKKVKFGTLSLKEKQNSVNEIRILASISHPNVITFKEAFIDETSSHLCLITEFADRGDLLQKINIVKKRRTHFSEPEIWKIFIQILKGLKALHDLNILHRDMKCANVYLTAGGDIKIGDMNVSKVAKMGFLYTQTGTPYYASPEVWKDKPYDNKSDIWSLGCVVYEVAALNPPFKALDMKGLYRKVIAGDYPAIPSLYSEDLSSVIGLMLKVDPKLRPSSSDLLTNPTVLKYCEITEPVVQSQLLSTIVIPKKLTALTKSLPASNYASQKISFKFPEIFRLVPGSISISTERNESSENKNLDIPKAVKKYSGETKKAAKEKIKPFLPPLKQVHNKGVLRPSWG